jgi:hypothetical protein
MFENLTINVTALEEQTPFPDRRGLLPRLAAAASGLLSCWCLIVLGSAFSLAEASEPTVCAVIKAQASGEIATGAQELLEQSLVATPGMTLVERAIIDRVLGELALSASQENLDIGKRLQLGKLLKADILVFFSEATKEKNTSVSVRIVESETGLQLAAETFLWDKENAEATLASLFNTVSAGVERHKAGFRTILAVPPLECTDRSPAQAHWRKPLATLLQERLLTHKGILVVELEEARAFATEFFVGKEAARLKHDLPLYLVGQYSTRAADKDVSFSFDFKLEQGGKEILHKKLEDIGQASISEHFASLVKEVVLKLPDVGHDTTSTDPAKEAVLLMNRADLFRKLGENDVALPLYETVVLIDPANLDARVNLLIMLHAIGNARAHVFITDSWIPYEAGERHLWIAESGIEHLEYLCRNAPLSDNVRQSVAWFRQALRGLQYWAQEPSGEYASRALRFCRRREAAYLQFISRLQVEEHFDARAQECLIMEFAWVVVDAVRIDPEGATASMRQLFDTVRQQDKAGLYLTCAVAYLGTELDRAAPAVQQRILDELLASDRPDLKMAGKVGQICFGINSPETKEKGLAAIQALDEWKQLTPWQKKRIEMSVESCLTSRVRRGDTPPVEKTESVFLPRLEPVVMSLEDSGPLANQQVSDWESCEKQGDCIATGAGIFLVNGGSGRRISRLIATRLCWDGRWIWATTEKAIVAIDPQTGSELAFGPDDLSYEVAPGYLLCPIKPGLIAVMGHLLAVHRSTRSWVSLLEITEGAGGRAKKARVIFDAREQAEATAKVSDRRSLKQAFIPLWAFPLMPDAANQTPFLAIGRGENRCVQPLLINLEDQSAALVQTSWPGVEDAYETYPYVIRHDGTFYIAMGQSKVGKAWAGIFQTRSFDAMPEMFANFGVRYQRDFFLWGRPYFCGGVVHNNVLHLLTSFPDMSPHWVAVDLKTRQTSELVTTLPPVLWGDYQRGGSSPSLPTFFFPSGEWDWRDHRLMESSKQELIFLAQGRAYSVTLPDQSTWPRFPKSPTNETMLYNWPPAKVK